MPRPPPGRALRGRRRVRQRPYVPSQMTAWGLSFSQPPYFLPRAHTSAFVGTSGTTGGTAMRGPGCGGSGRGAVRGWPGVAGGAAAGGGGVARRGAGALGEGLRGGPMSSSASRAGACTICGSASPSGRGTAGPKGADGAGGRPEEGGRWTVTQPERAVTATVTRSVAVVVDRCTRATLLCPALFGGADKRRMPRTGDPSAPPEGAGVREVTRTPRGARRDSRMLPDEVKNPERTPQPATPPLRRPP